MGGGDTETPTHTPFPPTPRLEDAFGDFQSFLFHPGERGAGAVLDFDHFGEASLLEHEVVIGGRVHGVEDVGVVGNFELYGEEGERKKKEMIPTHGNLMP